MRTGHMSMSASGVPSISAKSGLEPNVELADKGDLTDLQVKQVLGIAAEYRERMLRQWEQFKQGKHIRVIKAKKQKDRLCTRRKDIGM